MTRIDFHFEETQPFSFSQTRIREWLEITSRKEGVDKLQLNIIFCSDPYLLTINQQYLAHDDYTDIITFDHSESTESIEGDLFISVERVRENATRFDVTFTDELDRVMVHGLLHLLGYKDKSSSDQETMKEKENLYLSLRQSN